MATQNSTRSRGIASQESNVGAYRYSIYKGVISRVNEASKAGFNLEAITLLESIIADRLESRLSHVLQGDYGFKTLEKLIRQAIISEPDDDLRELITSDLMFWKDARNKALHEMAKIECGDWITWDERIRNLSPITKEGLRIFRAIDKRLKVLRRKQR